ncbi:putative uncharacterized protein DDB_G0282129 [Planococcus citri]|uniref:putative uncharacterized protein DDB_G0282129 n=1 Tax=Planococcus citri TaxID=170843 RepID=UPI0031F91096
MGASITKSVEDFASQIDDLENKVSNRKLTVLEAKIYYDHLTSVYENVKSYETQLKTSTQNESIVSTCFNTIREIYSKVIDLEIKLTKVLESTSSSEINIEESNATKESETAKNLHLQLRKQSYLIRQMKSLETQKDICATKAEILNKHLSQLYDTFTSNQILIEGNVDDGDSLQNQQKISTDIQQMVIDFQTKLKKIIKPTESTGYKRPTLTEEQRKSLMTGMAHPSPTLPVSPLPLSSLSSSPSSSPSPPLQQQQQQQLQWENWPQGLNMQQQLQFLSAKQQFLQNQVGNSNGNSNSNSNSNPLVYWNRC